MYSCHTVLSPQDENKCSKYGRHYNSSIDDPNVQARLLNKYLNAIIINHRGLILAGVACNMAQMNWLNECIRKVYIYFKFYHCIYNAYPNSKKNFVTFETEQV